MENEKVKLKMSELQNKLGVLIDADNAQPSMVGSILAESSNFGSPIIKRIYGDWTKPNLKGWKEIIQEYGIHPVQQFENTTGKNSTDNAMIIDAMDLLYGTQLDGFCIVSSDSDFTRLASRLRESGKLVYGFGEKKTPKSFINACDKFIYTEILNNNSDIKQTKQDHLDTKKIDKNLVKILETIVKSSSDESGWAYLGLIGSRISNQIQDFDPRNFGFEKLGELMKACKKFELRGNKNDDNPGSQIYVRIKPN